MTEVPQETAAQQSAPAIVRQEFGAKELVHQRETSAAAVAAQARALVEARYIMALQRPRDIDQVRVDILKECRRPRFAEKAKWRRPVGDGKTAEGPSIRFTEAAARCMGNMDHATTVVYDDPLKRIVRIVVTELEKNVPYAADVTVEKTVERKKLKPGQIPVGSRINSYGERVYLVEADEGALLTKQNAQISKALRVLQLRVIPGDLVEEAMDEVVETLRQQDKADPEASKKKLIDSFADLGVTPDRLKAFLGHPVGEITPAERDNLRAIYTAIKDGETTWAEVVEAARVPEETPGAPAAGAEGAASQPAATKTDKMAEQLRGGKKKPPAAAAAAELPAGDRGSQSDWTETFHVISTVARSEQEANQYISEATGDHFRNVNDLMKTGTAEDWKKVQTHMRIIADDRDKKPAEKKG